MIIYLHEDTTFDEARDYRWLHSRRDCASVTIFSGSLHHRHRQEPAYGLSLSGFARQISRPISPRYPRREEITNSVSFLEAGNVEVHRPIDADL